MHETDFTDGAVAPVADIPRTGILGILQAAVTALNGVMAVLSAIAITGAGFVLTWEVMGRYIFSIASDWQDELSTFLLIGATFASAAWIQARRGHVGIDALSHILPPGVEWARRVLADVASLAFCLFFSWKSWELLLEAWEEGQTTPSAWSPPLWIPYSCMALGMTLLSLQILLQLLLHHPRRNLGTYAV